MTRSPSSKMRKRHFRPPLTSQRRARSRKQKHFEEVNLLKGQLKSVKAMLKEDVTKIKKIELTMAKKRIIELKPLE